MIVKERLINELTKLDNQQLAEVEEFISFLKFKSRFLNFQVANEKQLANLYQEFADEDRLLAEEGMDDYSSLLAKEDDL
jgi:hypothetical protein